MGGEVGSPVCGVAFNTIEFAWGSMVMALSVIGTVLVVGAVFVNTRVRSNRHHKIRTVDEDSDKKKTASLMKVNIECILSKNTTL